MSTGILNKRLWTEITRLKLLNGPDASPKFLLEQSPFDRIDGEEQGGTIGHSNSKELLIIGRISPKSDIYKERTYRIALKISPPFPLDPPEVRLLTPIYHPNINVDGRFSSELLRKYYAWTVTTSLVRIIADVVAHIDHPDIDFSIRADVGREYIEHKTEFDRKAMECVQKHALPRF